MQANITAHLLYKKKKKINDVSMQVPLKQGHSLYLQLLFLLFSSSCAITAKKQVSV